jgi:ATP-binding cassette subfamily F protein uup
MANLINLERVSKSYGVRPLLDNVSLGISLGERVGVVGRNGDGKTTLLEVMTGIEEPDSGRVSRTRGVEIGYLHQADELIDTHTVRETVLGGRADHEWAADPTTRQVVEELLAGVTLDRAVVGLSGGERRRCALAALLLSRHDLIVLDEPTNHLDVEAVAWLASHLVSLPSALIVVTHDRWFLDAVCQTTWEVHDGAVDAYEGGYAAYVLAKAERQRQAAASETRRLNLARKELAWLRRGAPARTSKPKFRIEAANALIEDVPPPRDRLELQRFASQRLGKDVIDIEDVDLARGDRVLLDHATWRIGPGDRIGIVGVNGAGKTSLLSLISGDLAPDVGRVKHGRTVQMQHLTQALDEVDTEARVLPTVESIRRVTRTLDGQEISATSLLERFGFTGDRLTARLGDLSGGERRRFQLLRLLLSEPNVLLLDEPTNDLDIETLNVLEDFLDSWPGTLIVVSHDRYFLERVTDSTWALLGDGQVSMLPRGVDEYLERRAALHAASGGGGTSQVSASTSGDLPPPPSGGGGSGGGGSGGGGSGGGGSGGGGSGGGGTSQVSTPATSDVPPPSAKARPGSAEDRAARKVLARVEKQLERIAVREAELHAEMEANLTDYALLARVGDQLAELAAEKEALELEWLEASEVVE